MVDHAIGIDERVVVTEHNDGHHHFQFSDSKRRREYRQIGGRRNGTAVHGDAIEQ